MLERIAELKDSLQKILSEDSTSATQQFVSEMNAKINEFAKRYPAEVKIEEGMVSTNPRNITKYENSGVLKKLLTESVVKQYATTPEGYLVSNWGDIEVDNDEKEISIPPQVVSAPTSDEKYDKATYSSSHHQSRDYSYHGRNVTGPWSNPDDREKHKNNNWTQRNRDSMWNKGQSVHRGQRNTGGINTENHDSFRPVADPLAQRSWRRR